MASKEGAQGGQPIKLVLMNIPWTDAKNKILEMGTMKVS